MVMDNNKSNYPPCEEFAIVGNNNTAHGKYSSVMKRNRNMASSARPSSLGGTNNEVIPIAQKYPDEST